MKFNQKLKCPFELIYDPAVVMLTVLPMTMKKVPHFSHDLIMTQTLNFSSTYTQGVVFEYSQVLNGYVCIVYQELPAAWVDLRCATTAWDRLREMMKL